MHQKAETKYSTGGKKKPNCLQRDTKKSFFFLKNVSNLERRISVAGLWPRRGRQCSSDGVDVVGSDEAAGNHVGQDEHGLAPKINVFRSRTDLFGIALTFLIN